MFCSIIDYGNICLSSCNENDLNVIQTLQNQALRCCYSIRNPIDVHVNDLYINADIRFVGVGKRRQILTWIWQNINNGVIEISKPECATRLNIAPSIYLPVPKTTVSKKSVYYYDAILWHAFPRETRLCTTLDQFKSKLYKEI